MSTRISAGVSVTTLVFLLFIYMIPIDCKITLILVHLKIAKQPLYTKVSNQRRTYYSTCNTLVDKYSHGAINMLEYLKCCSPSIALVGEIWRISNSL